MERRMVGFDELVRIAKKQIPAPYRREFINNKIFQDFMAVMILYYVNSLEGDGATQFTTSMSGASSDKKVRQVDILVMLKSHSIDGQKRPEGLTVIHPIDPSRVKERPPTSDTGSDVDSGDDQASPRE